jgi:hypothetical protein
MTPDATYALPIKLETYEKLSLEFWAVLIFLLIIMLLVGGGLFPPVFGVVAGIIGTRIKPSSESTKKGGF